MNSEPQETLDVSSDVVEQLGSMLRTGQPSNGYGQGPMTNPSPPPDPRRSSAED